MAVPQKMEKYCNELTKKLITESFPKSGKISGQEILSFSPIKQLNLFIIKNLLIEWQREIDNLQSPYFDFESDAVIKGLNNFANLLSRHILVSKEDFEPMVYHSALETITLLTTPYEFYVSLAKEATERSYTLKELKSIDKYIKHNKFIYSQFLKELDSVNYSPDSYSAVIEGIFQHTDQSPDDPELYIKDFSQVHPFDVQLLQEERDSKELEIVVSEETEVQQSDQISQSTVYDSLIDNSSKSLADIHQEKKIEDIRKALNLNQKFMFINGLFDGDEALFNNTIDNIEKMSSIEEARSLIEEKFSWDAEQEEVSEFYELISKRLS